MFPNVFEYHDPVAFLNDAYRAKQNANASFSLRSWAKHMGMNHVAMLSMVMNRKRKLLPTLSSKIASNLRSSGQLSEVQARYFDLLVLHAHCSNSDEREFYERLLGALHPKGQFHTLELDWLKTLSEWYHLAIVEMTAMKKFKSDPDWICLQLGDSVNKTQVEDALARLIRLEILEKKPGGKLVKTQARYATPTDIANAAIRKLHAQMIEKAIVAQRTQPIEARDITGHTVCTTRGKISEAKKRIRDFRQSLARFLESENGDTVYQLNIQLYDLLTPAKATIKEERTTL